VYDLDFVKQSPTIRSLGDQVRELGAKKPEIVLREPFATVAQGGVPGEDVLVRRMLWEIILRSRKFETIDPDRIIFFDSGDPTEHPVRLKKKLDDVAKQGNTLVLSYDAQPRWTADNPILEPKASVSVTTTGPEDWDKKMLDMNARKPDGKPSKWTMLLADRDDLGRHNPITVLRGVLVLKRLLAVNGTLPLTLRDFKAGRQLVFPATQDLEQGFHVVDEETARYFYEVTHYYAAFDQEFKSAYSEIQKEIEDSTLK
jgi:hypothetical protein